ncbi:MAG: hypothetical protein GY765_37285, partial [bacterium]|nr:hypothetical protein [bacterium]
MDAHHDEIDLVQLARIVIKRKWLIVGGTFAATLLALLIAVLLPKVYSSGGVLQLSGGIDIDLLEV